MDQFSHCRLGIVLMPDIHRQGFNVGHKTGDRPTSYYYAGSTRIAMRLKNLYSEQVYYFFSDHLGSTNVITDQNGNVMSETLYKAWGEVRYSSASSPTDFTYTGQRSEMDDIGLMFYNARFYDPELGRFAQADTIVPGAGNPAAYDRYAYVVNNPIMFIDSSGHDHCDEEGNCYKRNGEMYQQRKGTYYGLSSPGDVKILSVFIAGESSSGNVPLEVDYMKAWALLNKRTFDLSKGRGWSPLENWKNHERPLLDLMNICGSLENQENELLDVFSRYKQKSWFLDLSNEVNTAARVWSIFGTNSSYDPVKGANDFTDAAGLYFPTSNTTHRLLSAIPNSMATIQTDFTTMNSWRLNEFPNSSELYSTTNIVIDGANKKVWTFTWFRKLGE